MVRQGHAAHWASRSLTHLLFHGLATGVSLMGTPTQHPGRLRVLRPPHDLAHAPGRASAFPRLGTRPSVLHLQPGAPPHRKVFDVSDFILAPSESVRREIISENLFPADRIQVIPYGISESFFEIENRPIPGRVLYVGSVSLAKGIQYLAQASQEIAILEPDLEVSFQIAGNVPDTIRNQSRCSRLEFLGRLPRTEVASLYETADVLVFPTLSDSFGAVVLEAMAAGIPVICSPYCTDAVQDGISGFVVEPRDTALLASTIARVIEDRDLRHRLSIAAKQRAREFTWDRHRQALASTLRQIHEQRCSLQAPRSSETA